MLRIPNARYSAYSEHAGWSSASCSPQAAPQANWGARGTNITIELSTHELWINLVGWTNERAQPHRAVAGPSVNHHDGQSAATPIAPASPAPRLPGRPSDPPPPAPLSLRQPENRLRAY